MSEINEEVEVIDVRNQKTRIDQQKMSTEQKQTQVSVADYIIECGFESKAEFARSIGVSRQQITQWMDKKFIVIDHVLYSRRRSFK